MLNFYVLYFTTKNLITLKEEISMIMFCDAPENKKQKKNTINNTEESVFYYIKESYGFLNKPSMNDLAIPLYPRIL